MANNILNRGIKFLIKFIKNEFIVASTDSRAKQPNLED